MSRIILIHFRKIDLYPPVINLTRFLSEQKGIKVVLFSASACSIRFGSNVELIAQTESTISMMRWLFTLRFYFRVFHRLAITTDPVLYIESISSWPVWLYLVFFRHRKRKIAAHFHEYFSREEYRRQSFLERVGRVLERKQFNRYCRISHTNADRLSLFQEEYPDIQGDKLKVMPNFPPSGWINQNAISRSVGPVKLVYIGSISFRSFFLKEFINWLKSKDGIFTCDFYSLNAQPEAVDFINKQAGGIASFKGSVLYEDLPKVLAKYHVGLVMYNMTEKNMIYNAPNKLFEYLACGLDVWFSATLVSSYPYETHSVYPKVVKVDFCNLENFDYKTALSHEGLTFKKSNFVMEPVYEELYNTLMKA